MSKIQDFKKSLNNLDKNLGSINNESFEKESLVNKKEKESNIFIETSDIDKFIQKSIKLNKKSIILNNLKEKI
jgi:hypothetical protein